MIVATRAMPRWIGVEAVTVGRRRKDGDCAVSTSTPDAV